MFLSPWLLFLLTCCPPEVPPAEDAPVVEPEIQVFEKLHVLTVDGEPAGEQLAGSAKEGLFLRLEFIPAMLDPDQYEREIKPNEEWRIVATVSDANGVYVSQFAQPFYTYEWFGYCTSGTLWFDAEQVHWVSPEPPETIEEGWEYRWGYIDLPEEAGDYHLTLTVYPSAEEEHLSRPGQPVVIAQYLGEGTVVYEADVAVEASTHPMNLGRGSMGFSFVTPRTRLAYLAELKRIGRQ